VTPPLNATAHGVTDNDVNLSTTITAAMLKAYYVAAVHRRSLKY